MKQYEALGVIEAQYFTNALEILDQMCKGSNVEFLCSEKYLGGRLVTLIVGGSISDVNAAVETAKQVCQKKLNEPLKMALIITNPHSEILRYILPKQEEAEETSEQEATQEKVKKKSNKKTTKKTKEE